MVLKLFSNSRSRRVPASIFRHIPCYITITSADGGAQKLPKKRPNLKKEKRLWNISPQNIRITLKNCLTAWSFANLAIGPLQCIYSPLTCFYGHRLGAVPTCPAAFPAVVEAALSRPRHPSSPGSVSSSVSAWWGFW